MILHAAHTTLTHVSVCLSLSLSVCLSVCLSACHTCGSEPCSSRACRTFEGYPRRRAATVLFVPLEGLRGDSFRCADVCASRCANPTPLPSRPPMYRCGCRGSAVCSMSLLCVRVLVTQVSLLATRIWCASTARRAVIALNPLPGASSRSTPRALASALALCRVSWVESGGRCTAF